MPSGVGRGSLTVRRPPLEERDPARLLPRGDRVVEEGVEHGEVEQRGEGLRPEVCRRPAAPELGVHRVGVGPADGVIPLVDYRGERVRGEPVAGLVVRPEIALPRLREAWSRASPR